MRDPSRLKAAEFTVLSWPRRTAISSAVRASQIRAVLSADAVTTRDPSGLDANARLGADVDRYSFIVVDLHHLLLAGLPAHFESYMPSQAVSSLWLRRSTYGACLGVARLTVSRAFELALSVRSPADEWEQRARGEP